ncbi:MAG: molybdopterin oxidoreductase [Coriobacteriia bacterium]|nr:MAG: molybdopterin oxidoreductase [Coriobacteriia bacterium]
MADSSITGRGLSRRDFLKVSGVTAGALGLACAGGMTTTKGWLSQAEAAPEEHVARTYHQSHCGGMCSLACTVRDGRMVKVQPNGVGNPDFQTICLKGISEVAHIYGKGRVQTPLKRVGERGSGQFEPISWDQALDEVSDLIKKTQDAHGRDSVMVVATAEADFGFLAPMLGAQTGGFDGIDVGIGNGLDPAMGFGSGYAMCAPEARDWTRSKLVLTVGSNYCESSLPNCFTFFDAKEAGAHMVTVDPHYSTTASKSDEWIPIEPGTDAALFLGMISHIIDNDLTDTDFMRRHTSMPFLVDAETGMIIRDHAVRSDAEEPETGQQNPYYVINPATGAAVPYASCPNPSLSGSAVVRGRRAVTVWDLLLQTQKPYTVNWAAEITGIDADRIEALAEEYAKGPSSLALGWGGNDKMTNADIAGHAAAVLVAVTGNVGKPGTGVGVYVGQEYNSYAPELGAWEMPADWAAADSEVNIYDMPFKENNCHAAIFCGDIVAQHMANMNETCEWAKTLDFIVTMDPYFTEGAKWSDYILPCTSRFEYDEPYGNVKTGYSQIVIQEKVIDPLFEARTDLWIQRELAKRLGLEAGIPASSVDRCNAILSTSEESWVSQLTVEKIAEEGAVWPVPGREEIREVVSDGVFPTPSGRMELYYDNMVPFDQQLPRWEACTEIANEDLRKTFPLQLTNTRTRFRIHNQFYDSDWLQLMYEPLVMLNPTDMESRGLKTGDVARVFNDRGSFEVHVASNNAIRPGSVRIYEAATADYTVEGNLQSVTNNTMIERGYDLMCGPVIPFSDTLVEIERA